MNAAYLIKMANQIGDFYSTMPNQEAAQADLAAHFQRFWDPRMRAQLLDILDSEQAQELAIIVRQALTQHRSQIG